MFCAKCGNEVKEGVKFCVKCGTPVQGAVSAPQSVPPPQQTPVQQAAVQPVYQQPAAPAQQAEQSDKLLFAAFVIGLCWIIPAYFIGSCTIGMDSSGAEATETNIFFLGVLITAVVLNGLGWKKNNAVMALVAGIFYFFSLNIPSMVMCFMGYGALKKRNRQKA